MNGPSTMQAIVIGVCLGAIYGLFFYQRYRRQYFWAFTALAGGLSSAASVYVIRTLGLDGFSMAGATLQLAMTSTVILLANRLLIKSRHRRRHGNDAMTRGLTSTL
jgi:hypothetical protein